MSYRNSVSFSNLINKLNLNILKEIHASSDGSDHVVVGMVSGRKVILKTSSKNNEKKVSGYRHEALAEELISNIEKRRGASIVNRTKVLNSGTDFDFVWVLREYIDGEIICDYPAPLKETLFGYDILRQEVIEKYDSIIPKIVEISKNFNSIQKSDFSAENFSQISNRYAINLNQKNIQIIEEASGEELKEVWQYYYDNLENYRMINNFSFGDFVLPNFILADDKVYISDFEWFSFDNYMIDLAFLWLFLWRYPSWQRLLIKEGISNGKDEENFRLSIIRIVTNCTWHHRLAKASPIFVWYRYLQAAGKSFNELIEVISEAKNG